MIHDVSKTILKKIEKASFSQEGLAQISLSEFSDVDEVKNAILELEKLDDNKKMKFDFNEGSMILSIYDPAEDIQGFEHRHPNPKQCSNR